VNAFPEPPFLKDPVDKIDMFLGDHIPLSELTFIEPSSNYHNAVSPVLYGIENMFHVNSACTSNLYDPYGR
jgi:hypothetical protein